MTAATNGGVIEAELDWFGQVLAMRFDVHAREGREDVLAALPPPPLPDAALPYAEGVRDAGLSPPERLILILAILPHLRPQALDSLLIRNHVAERRFTEFGGVPSGAHSGFRPTRETALFLLAGESMDQRLAALRHFGPDKPLQSRRILEAPDEPGEAGPWQPLVVSERWIGRLVTGEAAAPRFGPAFPAQRIVTAYGLDDLVLGATVRDEIAGIVTWVRNEERLMEDWGLARHVRPGYRALFHGPPGTGKTMTAAVLGNALDLPVFRVDLSRVVSKWIGETEKNLGALFDQAAEGDMLLFFDEADALFGKRGETRSANDRHANQQIGYLLQRIEECPGVVILASNLRDNIDQAFARRFQAMVYFAMPGAAERRLLWESAFSGLPDDRAPRIDFARLARDHELAGGTIINATRHACLRAATRNSRVEEDDIRASITRELEKEGRYA